MLSATTKTIWKHRRLGAFFLFLKPRYTMEEQPKHVKTSKEIKQDAKTKVKKEIYKLKEEQQPIEVKRTKLSLFGEDSCF